MSIIDDVVKQLHSFQTPVCTECGSRDWAGTLLQADGKVMCGVCANKYVDKVVKQILVTTTPTVDGYRVTRYLGVEAVEIVVGSGPFSEFTTNIQDFLGARSTAFEEKLHSAKAMALKQLAWKAHLRGGNAVVGIDLDYTEFSGNRIGVVVNGTVVDLVPGEQGQTAEVRS